MKNTKLFTHTVADYDKYRPSYPTELLELLVKDKYITHNSVIADIGAGTGIFTKQLLSLGNEIYLVEPNEAMYDCAKSNLLNYDNLHTICATAENTTLPDGSIDLITVATAFHWFDEALSKKEFKRILKKDGRVMLLWNLRRPKIPGVSQDYENLLKKYCPNYIAIPSEQLKENEIVKFFLEKDCKIVSFDHFQLFDLPGFLGRLKSTSYALQPTDPQYADMITDLKTIFNKNAVDGVVKFPYKAKAYIGRI